ncbi:hypothetical protein Psch_00372 [Pelotomaculum schinkii]|uniref:Uncharacterized protein n=1 Tax=Pelotomaculum schinkii TaxID=78350 RepID=A0A4Y7RDI7_9FIRM|nr:hypothetical protein [Pelotomaculum schinkii]TEB06839.1 hypothetical protein Psch_00372 [Pelotomaculum schinkii]
MLEKLAGIIVILGLILSVVGEFINSNQIRTYGILLLLATVTVAGIRYIRFHLHNPAVEFEGVCIEYKRLSTHCVLSIRTGWSDVYYGQASLKTGAGIKVGDKIKVKVRGRYILEVSHLNGND